jgi:shikimate dehydrogenase
MKISGKTKVIGLLGYPVEHSLSPSMHNAAFAHLELDYCYVTFSVKPDLLEHAVKGIRALSLRGVNVTIPHKQKVMSFLDRIDDEASFIGAVNTVMNEDGVLTGFNTDGRGFMESLAEAGISVEGKTVLVVGAGGACRAISYHLSRHAASLLIFDIDGMKVSALVDDLSAIRSNVSRVRNLTSLHGADIVINATPLGMKDSDPNPLDLSLIAREMTVCDLIYKETPLLKAAAARGCKTQDGLGMLLHQGVLAFEIWTGIKPPVEVMRNAIRGGR